MRWRSAEIAAENPGEVVLIVEAETVADLLDRDIRVAQGVRRRTHFVMQEGPRGGTPRDFPAALGQRAHAHAELSRDDRGREAFGEIMREQMPQAFTKRP